MKMGALGFSADNWSAEVLRFKENFGKKHVACGSREDFPKSGRIKGSIKIQESRIENALAHKKTWELSLRGAACLTS